MSINGGGSHILTRSRPAAAVMQPTPEQLRVITNTHSRLRVLAGPGTGKTATLVEAVAHRVHTLGVDPSQILVLTFSRRAAAELTSRIVARLGVTTREPVVRTLHSYAFSLVRQQAIRAGEAAPRLVGAAESDQMIRELLVGHAVRGGGPWPDFLHQALRLNGFAAELRDLLARTTERGLGPTELVDWGRRRHRPEWVAAGQFAREFSKVVDLRTGTTRQGQALDQAELMGVALGLLNRDEVLAAEQARIRRIFVDEYQDVDPAQVRLIQTLATGADELIVVGDPDQSIYAFRGSEPTAMQDIDVNDTVSLTVGRRMAPEITAATRRVASLLPGPAAHRDLTSVPAGQGAAPLSANHTAANHTAVNHSAVNQIPANQIPANQIPANQIPANQTPTNQRPGEPQLSTVPQPDPAGSVEVRVFSTAAAEAAFVADSLRRAHLIHGVRWSEMAVLVRSPAASLPALRRAFTVMGVPLAVQTDSQSMLTDATVLALMTVLTVGVDPAELTGERAEQLLTSPLGGVDALAMRRLRRALKAARPNEGGSQDLVAAVLAGAPAPADLADDLARPLALLTSMIEIVRARSAESDAEGVLWAIWQRSGLEQHLVESSDRGGRGGQRADATLDALVVLFEAAARRAALLPGAGIGDFVDSVLGREVEEELAGPRESVSDAVQVLSAHAAKGLEWEVVAIAGVAEGKWPGPGQRSSLLGTQDLLDLANGLAPGGSRSSQNLAEERRLFYVAATRARRILIATAVADAQTQPSRFLVELLGTTDLPTGSPVVADGGKRRGLNIPELIAELRSVASDPVAPPALRATAASHLADLAAQRVRGADPEFWWGLPVLSTTADPIDPDSPVTVSPSVVEALNRCALGAVLERQGGRGESGEAQLEGIVVHAMAHGIALQVPWDQLVAELDDYLASTTHLAPWQLARLRRLAISMTSAAQQWYASAHPPWTVLGSEVSVQAAVPVAAPSDHLTTQAATRPVNLNGRADWISLDESGRPVIIDFKTGSTIPSRADAEKNPQLAAYQVAIGSGGIKPTRAVAVGSGDVEAMSGEAPLPDEPPLDPWELEQVAPDDETREPSSTGDRVLPTGGAALVYLRKGVPSVRPQPALTESERVTWIGEIRMAAAHLSSAAQVATENKYCDFCSVRSVCPIQDEGRQATR